MKCLKNPRRNPKLLRAVDFYEQACNINLTVIANLLWALHELYPKRFDRNGMEHFLINFMDSVRYLEADDDVDVQEYRKAAILEAMPYVTPADAASLLRRLASLDEKNSAVMQSEFHVEGLVSNTLLLLMTLHADYGFGERRIGRVMDKWCGGTIENGEEWLAANLDFEHDRAKDRRAIEDKLLAANVRKTRSTVREQLDARRELEALKAYQDGVKNGS